MDLDSEARLAFEQQDYQRSRQLFQQSLEVCRLANWKEEVVYGLLHVTQAMNFEPDYEPAKAGPLLEEALQAALEIGTDRYIIPVQINRVRLYIDLGNPAEGLQLAQDYLLRAMEIADDPFMGVNLLTHIAIALASLGQADAALRIYGSTVAERSRLGGKITEPHLSRLNKRLAPARSMLSKDRQNLVEAEGYGLSLEESIKFALSVRVSDSDQSKGSKLD